MTHVFSAQWLEHWCINTPCIYIIKCTGYIAGRALHDACALCPGVHGATGRVRIYQAKHARLLVIQLICYTSCTLKSAISYYACALLISWGYYLWFWVYIFNLVMAKKASSWHKIGFFYTLNDKWTDETVQYSKLKTTMDLDRCAYILVALHQSIKGNLWNVLIWYTRT